MMMSRRERGRKNLS